MCWTGCLEKTAIVVLIQKQFSDLLQCAASKSSNFCT